MKHLKIKIILASFHKICPLLSMALNIDMYCGSKLVHSFLLALLVFLVSHKVYIIVQSLLDKETTLPMGNPVGYLQAWLRS